MTDGFRCIDKKAFVLGEDEIAANRKRLEEREQIHFKYGMERPVSYWRMIDLLGAGGKKVLDVGTGRGITASLLAKKFADVTTVDISDESTRTALLNAAYEKALDRITYCICDAARLPFKDNEFDDSISVNGFHHFRDPEAVIREMLRVTKGTVVVADFSEEGFKIVRDIHKNDGNVHEEHENNVELVGEILSRAGLEPQKHGDAHYTIFVATKKGGEAL